jgi:hypothetical protein
MESEENCALAASGYTERQRFLGNINENHDRRMTMRRVLNTTLAIVCVAAVLGGVQAQAQETRSPAVRLHYDGNWPSDKEAQQLRDELYYNMAIQAYMTMLPALNTIGMRDGAEEEFGAGYNVVPMWKDRMDAKTWIPTPNADIMYALSFFDLKETGPLVVAAPPNVMGMFTDFFQRTLVRSRSRWTLSVTAA